MAKRNPHTGSSFDDFLKEENRFEEVRALQSGNEVQIALDRDKLIVSLYEMPMASLNPRYARHFG